MTLKLMTREEDGVAILTCSGRIVFGDESAALRDEVKKVLTQNKFLVINLGGVSYIDSGGLGTIVSLFTSARAAGGDIKLANLTQRVGDLLSITKLLTIFETYEGESAAIASFKHKATA